MAATKVGSIVISAQSVASAATYTTTTVDASTAYGCLITAQVVAGSTLTSGCGVTINASPNGGTLWVPVVQGMTGTAAGTYPFSFNVDAPAMQIQAVFTGNVGAAVTVNCQSQLLTAI